MDGHCCLSRELLLSRCRPGREAVGAKPQALPRLPHLEPVGTQPVWLHEITWGARGGFRAHGVAEGGRAVRSI